MSSHRPMSPTTVLYCALLLWLLSAADRTEAGSPPRSRPKRKTLVGHLCPKGCATCSSINGCVDCRPKYFLHLQRSGLRQMGVCVLSCPIGHVGIRTRRYSYCARCLESSCDVCLTKRYCTRCQGQLYEYRGRCLESCPQGLVPGNDSRECLPKVDCVVSEWGPWGVCAKNGRSCGAKYGIQTRVRQIIQLPSSTGKTCPENTENRKCLIDQPICPALLMSDKKLAKGRPHRNRKRRRPGRKRRNKKRRNKQKSRKLTTEASNELATTEISNRIDAVAA